jgi:hypothetical protein
VLIGGTKFGTFPTRDHAEVARLSTYQGRGEVVPR